MAHDGSTWLALMGSKGCIFSRSCIDIKRITNDAAVQVSATVLALGSGCMYDALCVYRFFYEHTSVLAYDMAATSWSQHPLESLCMHARCTCRSTCIYMGMRML